MNFTAYIERQKNIIKRHADEKRLLRGEETLSESEKLFCDLNSLKGLNTRERLKVNGAAKI